MFVYDSMCTGDLPFRAKQQIAAICFSKAEEITLTFKGVQRQKGSNDCGLFALAFATSLCIGDDPSQLNYIQDKLRPHLITCLEKNCLTFFPTCQLTKRCPRVSTQKKFPVYCLCRQPEANGDRMVQCASCQEWFHDECENVPDDVWNDEDYLWNCSKCH